MGWIKNLKRSGECKSCDCRPQVCDPCEECPEPAIKCRSRSASKTKCGFAEYDGYVSTPPKYYLHRVETISEDCTEETNNGTCHSDQTVIYTSNYNPSTCGVTTVKTGSSNATDAGGGYCHLTINSTGGWDGVIGDEEDQTTVTNYPGGCGKCCYGGEGADETETTNTSSTHYKHSVTSTYQDSGPDWYVNHNDVRSTEVNLTNEYTTSQLISNVESALPDWPDWPDTFSGACLSAYSLSANESTFSRVESQLKFNIEEPLELQRINIVYNEVFTPTGGSPTVTATGTATIEPGDTESEIIAIPVPDSNGSTTIVLVSYECEEVS